MICFATTDHLENLIYHDKHITQAELERSIKDHRILVLYQGDQFVGWLRYNLFWDNTPFMNLLYILSEYRGQGFGKQLMEFWESEMKTQGFSLVLTSTLTTETAQHFYRKLGYKDCGSFSLPNEPTEIIFLKNLAL